MLNLNSVMLGTSNLETLSKFYEAVLERAPDMVESGWAGWNVGSAYLSIGEHSEVMGMAGDPQRMMFVFETEKVKDEFERMKAIDGATTIKEPYQMGDKMWIATFADPDGNYFQLMSPWK